MALVTSCVTVLPVFNLVVTLPKKLPSVACDAGTYGALFGFFFAAALPGGGDTRRTIPAVGAPIGGTAANLDA